MKFIHRLGYYLGGFSIGLVLLLFFLNGKEASCSYGPNARTTKNISAKVLHYTEDAAAFAALHKLDSLTIKNLIQYGTVDFSRSKTKIDSCKLYYLENSYKTKSYGLTIKNCDSIAEIIAIEGI